MFQLVMLPNSPRITQRKQRFLTDPLHLSLSPLRSLQQQLNPLGPLLPHLLNSINDSINLDLNNRRPVGQRRRSLRTVRHESIRHAVDHEPEISVSGLLPLLRQETAKGVLDVEAFETAGQGVVACCEYNDVLAFRRRRRLGCRER
jgi:hypothetical protein